MYHQLVSTVSEKPSTISNHVFRRNNVGFITLRYRTHQAPALHEVHYYKHTLWISFYLPPSLLRSSFPTAGYSSHHFYALACLSFNTSSTLASLISSTCSSNVFGFPPATALARLAGDAALLDASVDVLAALPNPSAAKPE